MMRGAVNNRIKIRPDRRKSRNQDELNAQIESERNKQNDKRALIEKMRATLTKRKVNKNDDN